MRGMVDKSHPSLSVGAQCRLLSISRSSCYYELMGEAAMNLDLMAVIDKPRCAAMSGSITSNSRNQPWTASRPCMR